MNFQVKESPAPLKIPTPTPAPETCTPYTTPTPAPLNIPTPNTPQHTDSPPRPQNMLPNFPALEYCDFSSQETLKTYQEFISPDRSHF